MQETANTGLNFTPPHNLIEAVSQIQQWHLAESSGQPFKSDFFTFSHMMGFMTVGIKQSLTDSVLWLLSYVVLGSVFAFAQEFGSIGKTTDLFFWKVNGSVPYWFCKIASYAGLAFSTFMCCYASRYYRGVVPKKAVSTLYHTRLFMLVCFSLVAFLGLGLVYKYLSDDTVSRLYFWLSRSGYRHASEIAQFVMLYLRRALFEASIVVLVASAISVALPYLTIVLSRLYVKERDDLGIEVN